MEEISPLKKFVFGLAKERKYDELYDALRILSPQDAWEWAIEFASSEKSQK